ncbi:hypothetical protein AXF42_Ash008949 [Apostasia shenzhenica]|uniref:Cardiolipin synthase N-terminal domain-containing protein n=1 Tax=Apostasia shenzhenica TaxID=1088818 RepID=A0A2I0ASY3_9ASPA|nr:hypothetical protein AXF42_Ash008949 [Apostasia shenzhenica]
MLLSKSHILSCNFPFLPSIHRPQNPTFLLPPKTLIHRGPTSLSPKFLTPRTFLAFDSSKYFTRTRSLLTVCRDSSEDRDSVAEALAGEEARRRGRGNDWTTSVLIFGLWAGLMYYIFRLAPDQTPYRDFYFVQKLFLNGDDGYRMNEVLVALWNSMGIWPLVYSMLLLPTGRSSRSKIPVWPFLVLSFAAGMYALIPYFILWKPPPPPIQEDHIKKWPLNFLESRITAGFALATGLGLLAYAGLASGEVWKEFSQYFRESKLVHVTSLDFLLCSAFAPFWVYNDMTARRW